MVEANLTPDTAVIDKELSGEENRLRPQRRSGCSTGARAGTPNDRVYGAGLINAQSFLGEVAGLLDFTTVPTPVITGTAKVGGDPDCDWAGQPNSDAFVG